VSLDRLIAEASVLAGGKHQCANSDTIGSPRVAGNVRAATDLYTPNCSQSSMLPGVRLGGLRRERRSRISGLLRLGHARSRVSRYERPN